MDFYEVLDQVVALLRSRGRVTYAALQLQFGLTDEQWVKHYKPMVLVSYKLLNEYRAIHTNSTGFAQFITLCSA